MKLICSIQSNFKELPKLTESIRESCRRYNYDDGFQNDIRLVLEEIVVNIIKHGYNDCPDQRIDLEIEFNSSEWKMTVEDQGIPFNPLNFRRVNINHSLQDMHIGGQGIHLVKQISKSIEYKRLANNKNRLTVILGAR